MGSKVITVRFPADQAHILETVARADETSVSEIVRTAVAGHIARRRHDPEFLDRLRALVGRLEL